jgi:hypothetical protein
MLGIERKSHSSHCNQYIVRKQKIINGIGASG